MVVLVIRAEEEDATRKENLRLRPYKRQQQRSEKMRFYHAAPKETMMKIYAEGVLKKSWDGVVYMCKDPIDACKFVCKAYGDQFTVEELKNPETGLDAAGLILEFQFIDAGIGEELTKRMEKIEKNFQSGK